MLHFSKQTTDLLNTSVHLSPRSSVIVGLVDINVLVLYMPTKQHFIHTVNIVEMRFKQMIKG